MADTDDNPGHDEYQQRRNISIVNSRIAELEEEGRGERVSSVASSDPPPPPPYHPAAQPTPPSQDSAAGLGTRFHRPMGAGAGSAVTSTQRVREMHEKERRTLVLGATGVLFDANGAVGGMAVDDIDSHPSIDGAGGGAQPSSSQFNPNLHLEMSSLVNSLHSPSRRSFSYSRRSVKDITRAQAVVNLPEVPDQQEELTEKAVSVIRRVMDKLTGLDFETGLGAGAAAGAGAGRQNVLDVHEQVDRLIRQATASENLCLSYVGWCPFW
jgi:hypothetical protein